MWLMLSVAAFVTSILVHAAAVRLLPREGAVPAFVAVGGVIGVALISYCALSYGLAPPTLAATLAHAFACELYIFLFTLVGNSVSFGLLTKLASHPLRPDQIAAFYRAEAMITRRFEQLEGSDFITTRANGVKLTARGKRVVRIFSLLHAVFGRPNRWTAQMTDEGDDAS